MTATLNLEDAIQRSRTEREESDDNSTNQLEQRPEQVSEDHLPKTDSGSLPAAAPA